jgi:Zn-dependent protease
MFRSFRIGRLFGFPIDINLSFLLLLAFVGIWAGGLAGIFAIIVAFGSVLLHELGHALVARHLGVPVSGIELYFFGGAAKMTGQPKRAGDEIAIAAAGPAVSFALAGLGTLLSVATGLGFFSLFAWINLFIGAFNLIPALPMDGGRILRAALSNKMGLRRATELSITVARGFAIALGVVGLVTFSIQLMLLAGVLWFLGSAELRNARLFGKTRGYGFNMPGNPMDPYSHARGGPPPWARDADIIDVMPEDFDAHRRPPRQKPPAGGRWFEVQRPRATGGFVIRQKNGRLVIEPL